MRNGEEVVLLDPSRHDPERDATAPAITPAKALVFHGVLVAGFLAVHFGVAPLW
jgi:hypothetical protein